MPIDWNSLAPGHDLGHGEARRVAARQAVSDVLGPDEMAAAVDASLNRGPGSNLAAAVLELLQPTAAMDRCLETLDRDDPPRRRGAAELLARIGDVHVADRLEGLLADADPSVAAAGAGLLHRLVWTGALPAATSTALVDVCLAHDVPRVRVIGLDTPNRSTPATRSTQRRSSGCSRPPTTIRTQPCAKPPDSTDLDIVP